MKIAIVILILLICTITSLTYSKRIKNHTIAIRQCILLIENIKILISYNNLNISEIFKIICNCNTYNQLTFLNRIFDGIDEYNKTLDAIFLSNNLKYDFDKTDIEYLKGFFSMLGKSDSNGQLLNCDLYKNLFEKKCLQLELEEKSKCKCTSILIFGSGILFLIITI